MIEPRVLLARIESERRRAKKRPGRILANVVVLGAVTQFDSAVLHRVEHLQTRYDLARSERLDLEFAVGCFRHIFGEQVASSKQGIERFRPTGSQSPFERRRRLRDGWSGDRGGRASAHCG